LNIKFPKTPKQLEDENDELRRKIDALNNKPLPSYKSPYDSSEILRLRERSGFLQRNIVNLKIRSDEMQNAFQEEVLYYQYLIEQAEVAFKIYIDLNLPQGFTPGIPRSPKKGGEATIIIEDYVSTSEFSFIVITNSSDNVIDISDWELWIKKQKTDTPYDQVSFGVMNRENPLRLNAKESIRVWFGIAGSEISHPSSDLTWTRSGQNPYAVGLAKEGELQGYADHHDQFESEIAVRGRFISPFSTRR